MKVLKVGDLVKERGSKEGPIGIITKEGALCLFGGNFIYVKWLCLEARDEPPVMRYHCDLELVATSES